MAGCSIGLPSYDIAASATPTWAVGTPNGSYPVANVITVDPGEVAKANETTATLRLTWSGSKVIVAVLVINTNLGGELITATIGSKSGSATVPDNPDGLLQNVWIDLDGAGNSGTTLDIAVTGADNPVAIGRVIALTAILEPHVKWGYDLSQTFPDITHVNSLDQDFVLDVPVRRRLYNGTVEWAEDYNDLLTLLLEARRNVAFAVIPNVDDPDCGIFKFVGELPKPSFDFFDGRFDNDTVSGLVRQTLQIKEVNAGVAL